MATVNLVSRDNGVGLSTDMDLLQAMLTDAGYDVARVSWQDRQMRRCDVVIFLELFNPRLMRYARKSVGIFNPEWFMPGWRAYLPRVTQLWAKGQAAHDTFVKAKLRSHLTGFLTRDLFDPAVDPATPSRALHLKGHSDLKNTPAVLEAWRRNPDLPPLTIIAQAPIPNPPPGVTVLGRLPFADLVANLNRHSIHVCPSRAEGWGHYITEGASTGAAVITTNASPMNENVRPAFGWLLPPTATTPRHWALEHDIDPDDLAVAVREAAALTPDERQIVADRARAHVAARNEQFRHTALGLMRRLT